MEVAAPRAARTLIKRARAGVFTLLVLLVAALAAAAIFLALQVRADRQEEARRQAALSSARQEALNLTTLDYKTFDHDVGRVLDLATGKFKSQYASKTEQLKKALTKAKVRSTGKVLSAGVVTSGDDSAQVLVVADQRVKSAQATKGVVRHYRMRLVMRREHGRWLVSGLGFGYQ